MQRHDLRSLVEQVRHGALARRAFIQHLAGLGMTAPVASMILMHEGISQTQPPSTYTPTRRGGGGVLRLLWWQAPTLLNPHFATGTKDVDAARIFYEPLAHWDADGNLVPVLAAQIPSLANGGVARDGLSVTWQLKRGVQWHDGT